MLTYFLADAARILGAFNELKSLNETCKCLYQGRSEQNLAVVAPYIFTFPHSIKFADNVLKKGWGKSWGIYVVTMETVEDIKHHFRKFLFVCTEEEKELYFRFYDPRVLRIFLPTCDEEQLKEFFSPVQQFICEDEDPAFALIFSRKNGQLVIERKPAQEILELMRQPILPGGELYHAKNEAATNPEISPQQQKPRRRFFD